MIHAEHNRFTGFLGQIAGAREDLPSGFPRDEAQLTDYSAAFFSRWFISDRVARRQVIIGTILLLALVAFELFNFDTTRFALQNLFGDVRFLAVPWATILAVAFCGIDFAGLARLFRPSRSGAEPAEVWYLMGAWFLAAAMNAMMTWWAVSVQLVDGSPRLGNEVLSREQLVHFVPIFVAVLVWLTRILIIGAVTMAANSASRLSPSAEASSGVEGNEMRQPVQAAVAMPDRGDSLRQDIDAAMQGGNAAFGAARRPRSVAPTARPTLAGLGQPPQSAPSHATPAGSFADR